MAFSTTTKSELTRVVPSRHCCQKAEFSALVRLNGTLQLGRSAPALEIVTENAAAARKAFVLFRRLFDAEAEISVRKRRRLKKNNEYVVRVPAAAQVSSILRETGLLDSLGNLERGLPRQLLEKRCCRRAYLRGAFLAKGSVTSPEKGYHLEIVAEDEVHAQEIADLMAGFEVAGKVTTRKGEAIVYVKESDQIARFLSLVGAHTAVLQFENVRVVKEMRNRVNRLTNAEAANMDKAVAAAVEQIEDIKLIDARLGLARLPHGLRELARARLENPEASLRELGETINPRVSKSGINYRFAKLARIAEDLRNPESIGLPANRTRGRKGAEKAGIRP